MNGFMQSASVLLFTLRGTRLFSERKVVTLTRRRRPWEDGFYALFVIAPLDRPRT